MQELFSSDDQVMARHGLRYLVDHVTVTDQHVAMFSGTWRGPTGTLPSVRTVPRRVRGRSSPPARVQAWRQTHFTLHKFEGIMSR